MEDDSTKGNVIKGPWKNLKKSGRKIHVPTNTEKVTEDLYFVDELTEALLVQLIHTSSENGFNIKSEKFIKDIGFIIEVTKGVIYRSMGIPYPTQKLLEVFVNTQIDADKSLRSEVDLEQLDKFLEMCKDEKSDD